MRGTVILLFLTLIPLLWADVGAVLHQQQQASTVDQINWITRLGGTNTRDGASRHDTVFLKISHTSHADSAIIDKQFVVQLADAIVADQCEPSFSGRALRSVSMTIYCAWLQNKERMSVNEKKPLPLLNNTLKFLATHDAQVDDYEYLGEYRRPAAARWTGSDDTVKAALRLYDELLTARRARRGGGAAGTRAVVPKGLMRGKFVEHMAPWGLDRIDMRYGALDNDYTYNNMAEDIDIYVVDTGIRLTHQEFQGRANFLINTVGDGVSGDCAGHGTHVSSLAAGVTFGAAKGASLWDAKSLGCNGAGDTYTIVTSVMAIIDHAANRTDRRAVVSMSLGGDFSTAINNAIVSLVQAGINVVVAAGNEYSDACLYSPSAMGTNAGVIAVGASSHSDARPAWSNYGSCVSLSAPGESIIGAYGTSNTATAILSGTSMATPFVTGVVALVLNQNLSLSVQQVKATVIAWQTPSVITGTSSDGGGKNLVYSLIFVNQTPPEVMAPTGPPSPPIPEASGAGRRSGASSNTLLMSLLIIFVGLISQ
jgi:subtilisin family serine protease